MAFCGGLGIVERRGAPARQGWRAARERRHRRRREDDAGGGAAHAGRRHKALARTKAPRPAQAGVTGPGRRAAGRYGATPRPSS
jgi:hypothetical protein